MKETFCLMLSILSALGALILAGSLIEGSAAPATVLGLAACLIACRGFYRLAVRPAHRVSRRPALRVARRREGLRVA